MELQHCSKWLACACALASAVFASPAAARADAKVPIFVSHSGTDDVGVALVAGIREALKRAATAAPAASPDDADVVLLVSTMNPEGGNAGTVTTAGWTLLLMKEATKAYVGGGLRMCDQGSLQKTAADLVAHVEALLKARSAELPTSPEREKFEAAWNEAVERAAQGLPEESCGVKVRAAFREQMRTYLQWTTAASLAPDVQQAVAAGLSYFTIDADFAKKLQVQAEKLNQCQAEVAALKKAAGPIKK